MSGNLSELGFNATTVEPATGFEPLPAGDYEVVSISDGLGEDDEEEGS